MSRIAKPVTDDPLIVRLLQSVTQLDPERLERLYSDPVVGSGCDAPSLEQRVIQSGVADENQIAQAYARHYLVPCFDPPLETAPPIDPLVACRLPNQFCRQHQVAPLSDDGQTLEIAIVSPDSLLLADEVRMQTGRQMRPLFTSLTVMERLLEVLYRCDDRVAGDDATVPATSTTIKELNSKSFSASEYVGELFERALESGASDIHVEPLGDQCRVRLRVSGSLTLVDPPPHAMFHAVSSHLKKLAKIADTSDSFAQEGTIGIRCGKRRCDVRVHVSDTVFGQKIVMRLLGEKTCPRDWTSLGLDERQETDLVAVLDRFGQAATPESIDGLGGMILVVGPVASGKRTTLYSLLNHWNNDQTSLCTVEETVKFKLCGVHQFRTRPDLGLTTCKAIRSSLRQDPDVVMVDQMDDKETAGLCFQAAMSGQKMLSSLYACDAVSALARLQSMGLEPRAISSTLGLLISQRRVRRLCDECKKPVQASSDDAIRHGIRPGTTVFQRSGCERCQQTGYQGYDAIFEVVPVGKALSQQIELGKMDHQTQQAMRRLTADQGIKSLSQSLAEKLVAGVTDLSEARKLRLTAH